MSIKGDVLAQYLGHGDPALADYYPAWLDNMADDATVEGSLLDGAVQGAEAVRSIVVAIRSLYDRQEHKFAGPCGENDDPATIVAQLKTAGVRFRNEIVSGPGGQQILVEDPCGNVVELFQPA